jgi:hypothetical protein
MKTNMKTPSLLVVALYCFALSPLARAVTPAPDGGYPGSNTAEGTQALFSRTTGVWNTALGYQALYHDTSGGSNTATGLKALFSNTIGKQNTATGVYALLNNTAGNFNIATGYQALLNNTTGANNLADGYQALNTNIAGNNNTAIGFQALLSNESGGFNTAIGNSAFSNGLGNFNIAVGASAGSDKTSGNNNIYIGDKGFGTESNTIAIGAISSSDTAYTQTFIGGIFGVTVSGGTAVYITSDGHLGTATSSARFKENIHDMGPTSNALLALRPVTFRYKPEFDPDQVSQFGLVAEEVEKINPALVVRDADGKPYTVRYDAINAMLLNELLKEHRKVEELNSRLAKQQATIAQQQKAMEAVTARLDAQDSKIQKVSDKVEMSRSTPRTVNNQ